MTLRSAFVMAGLALGLISGTAHAATITFSGVQYAPLTSYSEDGFTATTIAGNFNGNPYSGDPAPSVYTEGSGTLKFTRDGGGTFSFTDFDLSPTDGAASYTISGFRNGASQFTQTGSLSYLGRGFHFTTIASGYSASIDALTLRVSGTDPNIDNVGFSVPSVPLPASAPMFGAALLGLAGLGYGAKRRRAAAAA